MIGHLGALIGQYGYVIVGAFIFLEGMCLPFPTDTTLVTASAFAAHGRLSLWAIFVVSTITTALGTTVAFVLGRRGGAFFEKHSKRVNPAVLLRTRGFFDRHGEVAVVIGRFIPVARMLISPLAGLSTMSIARFSFFNFIGAALWSAVFCGVGYFFGEHRPAIGHGVVRASLIVAVGLAIVVTVLVAGGWLVEESDAAWRAEGTMWHNILMSAPVRMLAARSPALRRFLFQRFTANHYLGLNLTIGLGVSFIAIIVFSVVTHAMFTQDAVPQFDVGLLAALRETSTPARAAMWSRLATGGRFPVIAIISAVLALVSSRRLSSWRPVVGLIAALAGAALLDAAVSHFLSGERIRSIADTTTKLGTPSGQALSALVGYGMIAYFVILMVRGELARVSVAAAALAVVAIVSFGRLYTGERYFSDIVSGLAAGGVWLATCVTGLEVARRRAQMGRNPDDYSNARIQPPSTGIDAPVV